MIADNRELVAIRSRVAEYAKRAALLHKAAQAAQAKAVGRTGEEKKRIAEALAEAKESLKEAEASMDHVDKKMKAVDSVLKTKPDGRTAGIMKGVVSERDENAKNASGSLKTANQALELAKKILADAPALARSLNAAVQKLGMEWLKAKQRLDKIRDVEIPAKDKEIKKAGIKI
jgi:hypothetical protein